MDTKRVPRYTPPTPSSRRLGKELRRLRDAARLTLDDAGKQVSRSISWVSRIESGEIKVRPGDVLELLQAYNLPLENDQARALMALARRVRDTGWWSRLNTLPSRYATYIAYESEATSLRNFEPVLVPGLLQTEAYARAVISVGRETDTHAIEQRVRARLKRQEVLRKDQPLRFWAIVSEAVLECEVGEPDVYAEQLDHIVNMCRQPTITVQVLPFAAGAHLASYGGFAIAGFQQGDPDLGYIETLAGELFLESDDEIAKLNKVWDDLRTKSLSPAESVKVIRSRRGQQ